jgi:electron transfer flavoprotein beta subunit
MNIAVCIKQVPEAPAVKVDRVRMTIIRDGVENIINPLDYCALSLALRLRSSVGHGTITAITMGPLQSEEALREALAFGADRGLLLTDPSFAGADTLATSHVLARAITLLDPKPDLILCGNNTIDSDTAHVGPQVAEELGITQICGVSEIRFEQEGLLVAKRVRDGFLESLRVSPPVLFTVRGKLEPGSLPALAAVQHAFTQGKILRWGREDLALEEGEVGLAGSPTKVWRLRHAPEQRRGEILRGRPSDLAKVIVSRLEDLGIVEEDRGHA